MRTRGNELSRDQDSGALGLGPCLFVTLRTLLSPLLHVSHLSNCARLVVRCTVVSMIKSAAHSCRINSSFAVSQSPVFAHQCMDLAPHVDFEAHAICCRGFHFSHHECRAQLHITGRDPLFPFQLLSLSVRHSQRFDCRAFKDQSAQRSWFLKTWSLLASDECCTPWSPVNKRRRVDQNNGRGRVRRAAALMEPGRSCFTFLNVPSHACKLTFDLYKTVLHGTIKIEPPFSTDLFPPQAQDTALSASDSCQHLTIGDPRITQKVDKQPVGVREQGQGVGPQAKALAVPPKSLFRAAQAQQTTSYRSKNTRHKASLSRIRHCMAPSTDTSNATDTETHLAAPNEPPDPTKCQRPMFTFQKIGKGPLAKLTLARNNGEKCNTVRITNFVVEKNNFVGYEGIIFVTKRNCSCNVELKVESN